MAWWKKVPWRVIMEAALAWWQQRQEQKAQTPPAPPAPPSPPKEP